jgi:predicted nuclease with RNAse H fold
MPPTLTRMAYLTLRGIVVARSLRLARDDIQIVEVHPGGTMALRGAPTAAVAGLKHHESARRALLAWLQRQGLKGISAAAKPSDHYVAACAAALAAWKWHRNEAVWRHPAAPPHHPFDYAC